MPKLSIIIPCYFNEGNIPVTTQELLKNEATFPADVEVEYVMVDDGSKDGTWQALKTFQSLHPGRVVLVKLAGNVGSYNAIVAGMAHASGDCNVIIAADLQDPPELMAVMYEHWKNGIRLVVGNRADREESFAQRAFSNTYHSLIRRFALPNIPEGGFDYVFFDRKLREEAVRISENNTNSLYLLAWMNYEMVCIPYTRKKREIGKSRWTLKKKIKLFVDSFVSFSFAPIRAISIIGIVLGIAAFMYGIFILISKISGNIQIEGWTSLMLVFLFVSSFQMISLGIVGEYVWRGLDAARKRPLYLVDEVIR
jgi:dolichol-phosphate mannosyltransferase